MRVPVLPRRPHPIAVGIVVLLALALGAGCGPVKPMRGYRPEIVGASLGDGSELGRAIGAFEVEIAGSTPDETPEARRRRLEGLVRDTFAERGWFLDAGRPSTIVRVVVHPEPTDPPPATGALASSGAARGPGGWAPPAVAAATRVREALREDPAAGPAAGPLVELEVRERGVPAWHASAHGDAGETDPVRAIEPALRLLVWHLPDRRPVPTEVAPLAPGTFVPFYRDSCAARAFLCPALPFPVRFPELEAGYHRGAAGGDLDWKDTSLAHVIARPELLPAYRALVRGATRVLPGGQAALKRPFDPVVWEKATLVDRVVVGGETVVLWVTVADVPSGYVVKECGVADWKEGPRLLDEIAAWEAAVRAES